jgi:spermidine/putrescine transport system substrate-binding protein
MLKKPVVIILLWLMPLIVVLAACGSAATPAPVKEEAPAATTAPAAEGPAAEAATPDRCGDKSKLAAQLHMFNWSDYIDEEIFTRFEAECGVKVVQDLFTSNEDMIAKIQVGNSGYDLIIPSDYAVELMAQANLLAELDKANIPNISNLNPKNMGMYFDPDNKYSLPYQWGTTGLAYDATAYPAGPPDSWTYVFDPELVCKNKGMVSMLDDEREAIGAALKYLGHSYNDTDPAHQEAAKQLLLGQKECLAGYNSDNYNQGLAAEEIVLAQAYSGGAALGRDENPNIAFIIPKEGGTIWQDNLSIPMDAPNQYTAEVFINYLLDPEIGAQLTNYTYYFTPNLASEPLLDEAYTALLKEGNILPDDDTLSRLEWIKRDDKSIIFSDTWTAVKAQ